MIGAKNDIIEQLMEMGNRLCCVDRNLIQSACFEIERLRRLQATQNPQDIAPDDDLGLYIKAERLRRNLKDNFALARGFDNGI